jgi:hypothetical protein
VDWLPEYIASCTVQICRDDFKNDVRIVFKEILDDTLATLKRENSSLKTE